MIRNDTFLKKAEALKPELLATSQELLGEDRVLKQVLKPFLLARLDLYPDLLSAKVFLKVR